MASPPGYIIFPGCEPARYTDAKGSDAWVTKRDHGIEGKVHLFLPSDTINRNRSELEKMVVGYETVSAHSKAPKETERAIHPLYTMRDLTLLPYAQAKGYKLHVLADVSERIARRIIRQYLRNLRIGGPDGRPRAGKVGGIFSHKFDRDHKEGYMVTHKDDIVLKIKNYPNLVLLRKTGPGEFSYNTLAELDGLFDYRHGENRYLTLVETKNSKIKIDPERAANNLNHLRRLFPGTIMSYVLFAHKEELYSKARHLWEKRVKLYRRLMEDNVATVFFTFNESKSEMDRIRDHIDVQQKLIKQEEITFIGKMRVSKHYITLYDPSGHPIKMLKRHDDGRYDALDLAEGT